MKITYNVNKSRFVGLFAGLFTLFSWTSTFADSPLTRYHNKLASALENQEDPVERGLQFMGLLGEISAEHDSIMDMEDLVSALVDDYDDFIDAVPKLNDDSLLKLDYMLTYIINDDSNKVLAYLVSSFNSDTEEADALMNNDDEEFQKEKTKFLSHYKRSLKLCWPAVHGELHKRKLDSDSRLDQLKESVRKRYEALVAGVKDFFNTHKLVAGAK